MTTNAELRALAETARMDATDWYDLETLHDFLVVDDTVACGPYLVAVSPDRIIDLLDAREADQAFIAAAKSEMERLLDELERVLKASDKLELRLSEIVLDDRAQIALRAKLDIAVRALDSILGEAERGIVHNIARHALVQLKELP